MMHIKNETGRTLIEMMGVLAIMGVMLIGAMTGLRFGLMWMQVSSVYGSIENTAAGVIDIYSWSKDYPLSTKAKDMGEKIVKSGDVCRECVATVNGAELKLPWGSTMIVRPGDETYFQIAVQNVPRAACLRLREMTWNHMIWHSPIISVAGKDEPDCPNENNEIVFYSH